MVLITSGSKTSDRELRDLMGVHFYGPAALTLGEAFEGELGGKLAAAILAALDADNTPLRLVLGNDATDAISASLDNARAELTAWEPVARSTDFEVG